MLCGFLLLFALWGIVWTRAECRMILPVYSEGD